MTSIKEIIDELIPVLLAHGESGCKPYDFFSDKDYDMLQQKVLDRAIENDLIEWMGSHIKLTTKGYEIATEYGSYTNYLSSMNNSTSSKNFTNHIEHHIYGDNSTVVTGDKNTIKITINHIHKGEKIALKNCLLENGINEQDADELISIIDSDDKNENGRKFGQKVSSWLGNMITKAANGSWQIAIGAAGEMLADSIMKYYGWK